MRPIDADALKHELLTSLNFMLYDGTRMGAGDLLMRRGDVMGLIIDQPALDYAPVKHGEWDFDDVYVWRCTLCKKWVMVEDQEGEMNFCPNCGANMMDGGKNDVRITD